MKSIEWHREALHSPWKQTSGWLWIWSLSFPTLTCSHNHFWISVTCWISCIISFYLYHLSSNLNLIYNPVNLLSSIINLILVLSLLLEWFTAGWVSSSWGRLGASGRMKPASDRFLEALILRNLAIRKVKMHQLVTVIISFLLH